ncbi:phosphogluconate dehydratase [Wenzhouxiangella sp. AB-CW3]|uniref:phosphogluconate dehydratase n=1 Tax=Wenzhouxiangella sp. AB-CW3 TaxID=2771012 RepID=UPI00168B4B3A|nr:phosphogluconate dehydratase [Wenzhouxiangella sp. AB-CW3]QOC23027.1 phosphogluconate dehydratase [Wenzhouxiangella sp. AB-CW3]
MALNPVIEKVTERIARRSERLRSDYLERIDRARDAGPARSHISCGNLAHAFAAAGDDKPVLKAMQRPNIGIVSAYNDMLSAHQPFDKFPGLIKLAAQSKGCTAQFAGGVPAMCDGVTQGQPGMELSLFSRDVIAQATAVALSHNTFDAAVMFGVCDKIVPGLIIGALAFGHLPVIMVPAGPMPSGLPNSEKARIRKLHAEGKASREDLLEAESQSYHAPGTCTFYGTANSNQMLMEVMGLHLPGAAFINPNTPLRDALTLAAGERACEITAEGEHYTPIGHTVDEKALVNAMVGLAATGGSTNHAIHLVAMARAAGLIVDWDDLDELSRATPLLARLYPNGQADVNHFHAAGGLALVIRELLSAGLLHPDIRCVHGGDLNAQAQEPGLDGDQLTWRDGARESLDTQIVRPVAEPFSKEGGIRLLKGNLGRAIVKISAVAPEHRRIEAPAKVFDSQDDLLEAFANDDLSGDFVAVIRGQGPGANGMPELHKLTPTLQVLQDRGQRVALLTDGRMSGASGSVLAAIHVVPEAVAGGAIGKIADGEPITIDADRGLISTALDDDTLAGRAAFVVDTERFHFGTGRELFGHARAAAGQAEQGGSILFDTPGERR